MLIWPKSPLSASNELQMHDFMGILSLISSKSSADSHCHQPDAPLCPSTLWSCKLPSFTGVSLQEASEGSGPNTKSRLYTFLLYNLLFFPLSWLYCFIHLRDRMSRKQLKELFAVNLKHTGSERRRHKTLCWANNRVLPVCQTGKLNSFIS